MAQAKSKVASARKKQRKTSSHRSVRKHGGGGQSSEEGSLKVATPRDRNLKHLADAGIITPAEISSDEDTIPLDFTRLSSRGIGHLQSRYAVRHSHAIFNAAKIGSDVAAIKRDLRLEKAKFRLRHKKEKVNIVAAMMDEDDTISELEDKLLELETREDVLQAVAAGYADLRDAASREITRRTAERAAVD